MADQVRHGKGPRGTSPLDDYVVAPVRQKRSEELLRRSELALEIAQAEKLILGMRSRIEILESALGMTTQGTTEAESKRGEVLKMTGILACNVDLKRQTQIIVQQYHAAEASLREAQGIHGQFLIAQIEEGVFEGFSLQRFKGSVYPLFNFSLVFQGVPGLELFFDFLMPPKTGKLNPLHAPPNSPSNSDTQMGAALLNRGLDLLRRAPGLMSKLPFASPHRSTDD